MRNRLSVKPPKKRISRPRRGARGLKIRSCLEQGKAATLSSLPQAGDGGTDRCAAARSCPRRTVGQPDLPSGLMVFSAASFSLEPPLDMSAAMEKALAREESCGLGDAVNSMAPSVRSWPRTGPAELPSSFPKGDKNQHRAQSFQLQSQRSRELQMSQPQPDKSSPLASVPHCKALQPQRLPTSRRGQERTSLGLHRAREPWGAPQDHRLRRRKLEMSIGRAKPGGSRGTPVRPSSVHALGTAGAAQAAGRRLRVELRSEGADAGQYRRRRAEHSAARRTLRPGARSPAP